MADNPSAFSNMLTNLQNTAADFSTLTVTTATGNITSALKGKNVDLAKVDMEELFKKSAVGDANGNLSIAAIDSYKLDGDAFIFRSNSEAIDAELMQRLEEAHQHAILAGQELRNGIFNIVKDSIKAMVGGKK